MGGSQSGGDDDADADVDVDNGGEYRILPFAPVRTGRKSGVRGRAGLRRSVSPEGGDIETRSL